MKIPYIAVAVALLSALAFAACPSLDDKSYPAVCGVDAFNCAGNNGPAFIGLAFALTAFAIGLAYMYSKVREDATTGSWAKDEAANLGISVLLFAGVLAFFTGSCGIAQAYAQANPFSAAKVYLNTLLASNGQNLLRELTYSSINDQMAGTYYRYWGFTPFFGSGSASQADYRAYSAQKEFLIDLYIPIAASLNAQKYMLDAIQWVGASMLLPFAFVMRLVPPTRDLGNLLIAIFFAAYIVVPTMYAMSGRIFMEQIIGQPAYCVDCSNTLLQFESHGLDAPGSAQQDTVFYRLGSAIPQAVFLPNLVIVVAVTCTMAMSKALRAFAA